MLTVGQELVLRRTLSQADFDRFAALSGDDNPIHVDPAFAGQTRFGRTVSHGMLLYGLIRAALQACAPGAAQVEQELMFPNPTYAGEELSVCIRVAEVAPDERLARLETWISKAGGVLVCQGQTTLRLDGQAQHARAEGAS